MAIELLITCSRMFGPLFEIRRRIACELGQSRITIQDTVINRDSVRAAHNWLYHCNFGYPLLDKGTRLLYRGKVDDLWNNYPDKSQPRVKRENIKAIKTIPGSLKSHAGTGEDGCIVEVIPDKAGRCHVAAVNDALSLGVHMNYPAKALPRLANWHRLSPSGSFVVGLEPFRGSLFGKANDKSPHAKSYLRAGQKRQYELQIDVVADSKALKALNQYDGPVQG